MGSTYSGLHYHLVCSTKDRCPLIGSQWRGPFHQYLGGTIRGLQGVPLAVGGVEDHVHALLGMKPVHCASDFVREFKKATSVWAATNQSVFYTEREEVAVSDHCITSMAVGYHKVTARSLMEDRILAYLPAFIAQFLLDLAFGRQAFTEARISSICSDRPRPRPVVKQYESAPTNSKSSSDYCVRTEHANEAATDTASSKTSLCGSSVNVSRIRACRTKNSSSNSRTTGLPVLAQLRQ